MLRIVLSRVGSALAAIFGASIIAFILLRVLPGDPARLIAGPLASEETIEAQREQLGLNDPALGAVLELHHGLPAGRLGLLVRSRTAGFDAG